MRAAVLHGREDVRVERIPVPRPGPGELLLKVEAALTCGTDVKVFRRGYHERMIAPPSVFGHEMAGVVAAVGPGTARFGPGTRLVIANSAPCGTCYFCRREQENLCDDLQFLNGAYAEYLLVPARFVEKNAHVIADHLPFAAAALAEPLACVVHGVAELGPRPGDVAAVLGLGPIGLMFVALLKKQGLTVVGIEREASRLAPARALGADEVLVPDADGRWEEHLRARWPRLDVVVEATGRPEVWELALRLVRKGGAVQLFGGCPAGTKISVDTNRLHYDQITVKSSFHHRPCDVRAALKALEDGAVPSQPFISGRRPLEDLPALLREMASASRVVKICITTGGTANEE